MLTAELSALWCCVTANASAVLHNATGFVNEQSVNKPHLLPIYPLTLTAKNISL